MKSILIFYDVNSLYKNEKVFDGNSAAELCMQWGKALNCDVIKKIAPQNCLTDLFEEMSKACNEAEADYVIFSYDDLPFLNVSLTKELIESHIKYKSEYTFADGYSYGFAPELIDRGTLNILTGLSKTNFADEGKKSVCRDSIYNFLKKDINAYEVETLIAPCDFRLLRLKLECSLKENFIACKELFAEIKNQNKKIEGLSAEEINAIAGKTPGVLKTVPGFYNIQIAEKCSGTCNYCPYPKAFEEKYGKSCSSSSGVMKYEDFSNLVDKIAAFSENAVISLSLWGEAFNHPDLLKFVEKVLSYKGLSLFLETDGLLVTQSFCQSLKSIVETSKNENQLWPKMMIAVSLDAFTDETYKKIRGTEKSINDALGAVEMLESVLPGNVYPQFVRMNQNEAELEAFFRKWNERSPSFIIQKYDNFAKRLSDEKPADLSPVERNVCWHLRRELNILVNGDVPFCKECLFENITGNVFAEDLESVWKKMDNMLIDHINCKYCELCENCDEYYTFQF